MTEEIFPITPEYLTSIFQDPKFIEKLWKANGFEGFEAGFDVCQLFFEGKYGIRPVVLGMPDTMGGNVEIEQDYEIHSEIIPFGKERYDFYDLIQIHSHPEDNMAPSTDYGDLGGLNRNRIGQRSRWGLDVKTIGVIFGQTKKRKINLLMFQEKGRPLAFDEFQEKTEGLFDGFYGDEPVDEIAEELRNTGIYNAEAIALNGNGYSNGSLEKIARFAYTPRVVDEKRFREELEQTYVEED